MNSVNLIGRLTRDPELRVTNQGTAVATFTLAVDRPGNKDKADFIKCVAWKQTAEFVARNIVKGQRIGVTGAIHSRKWEDDDGNKRSALEVNVASVFFADSKRTDSSTSKSTGEFAPIDDEEDGELPF